jgi:flagellar hook assembly protein FlgD
MLDEALLTDTSGIAIARFLCTRARFAEFDTIRVVSGAVESLIGIYVDIPDSAVMLGKVVAFPNPFGFNRDAAEIVYYLNRSGAVDVRIFDPFGNEVVGWHFAAGEPGARAGINRLMWNGRNRNGRRVASGVYVVQVVGQLHTGTVFRSTYRLGVVW